MLDLGTHLRSERAQFVRRPRGPRKFIGASLATNILSRDRFREEITRTYLPKCYFLRFFFCSKLQNFPQNTKVLPKPDVSLSDILNTFFRK